MTASWVQDLMDDLGISGISQEWGEELGYYIWLSQADCSYALRMESCELAAPYQGLAKAIFSIRCFPYADSKIIHAFSPQERALLKSDLFDSTNTPRLECLAAIPAGYFVIAALEITVDLGCGAAAFILASLDHMVTRPSAPLDAVTEGSHYRCSGTANGLTLRNIPAWPLAYPLFDKIVSMYAFRFRVPPYLALHRETRGYEFIAEDGADLGYPVDSDASTLRSLTVAFQPHLSRQSIPLTQYLQDEIAHHSCEVLFDGDSSESHWGGSLFDQSRVPSLLDPLWWALPYRYYTSNLGTTCGCK